MLHPHQLFEIKVFFGDFLIAGHLVEILKKDDTVEVSEKELEILANVFKKLVSNFELIILNFYLKLLDLEDELLVPIFLTFF